MLVSLTKRLFEKLQRRSYRAAYVAEHVRTGIAFQVRTLLQQRGWRQKQLAKEMGKPASVISRLVDPDYGKQNVQTLLEVAAALDVALLIQYVSFSEFLHRTRDVSPSALRADSFNANQFLPIEPMRRISIGDEQSGNIASAMTALYGRVGPSHLSLVNRKFSEGAAMSNTSGVENDEPTGQLDAVANLLAAASHMPQVTPS